MSWSLLSSDSWEAIDQSWILDLEEAPNIQVEAEFIIAVGEVGAAENEKLVCSSADF